MSKPVKGVNKSIIERKADPHGPRPIPMPIGQPPRPVREPSGQEEVKKARKLAADPITRKPS